MNRPAPRPNETYWDYINRVAKRDATVVNTQYLVTDRPTKDKA